MHNFPLDLAEITRAQLMLICPLHCVQEQVHINVLNR